jgi:hypothetical protein
MGMGVQDLTYLLKLKANKSLDNLCCVCDIGATQLYLESSVDCLELFIDKFKKYETPHNLSQTDLQELANLGHAKKMWELMRYDYLCVDTSSETDTLNLDLNFDEVPIGRRGCAQLVMNMGTTEHVANQIQAFKIIHDVTAVGGLMYHNLPFQGYQTHGLINYTPKFFWMLCRSNEYEFLDFSIQYGEPKDGLHPDIIQSIQQTGNRLPTEKFVSTTSGIRTLLRKKKNAGFVPPFDGHFQGELNGIPPDYYEKYKA